MNRLIALVASSALLAGGLVGVAAPASAATTWDYPSASFSIPETGGSGSATVTVTNFSVTGSAANGLVTISGGGQFPYTCTTSARGSLVASWTVGSLEPCVGTVTFDVSPKGELSVTDSSVKIQSYLYGGAGTGSGTPAKPAVRAFSPCAITADAAGQSYEVTWTDQADAADYDVAINGLSGAVVNSGPGVPVELPFSLAPAGTEISATVTANRADGQPVATCKTATVWTPPAAPQIDGSPVIQGGLMTVNYSLPDPTGVQGIEYQVGGGSWLRPGGASPVPGAGGSFTVPSPVTGDHRVVLRTVGSDLGGPLTTESAPVTVTVPPLKNLDGANNRPTRPGTIAAGSSPSNPVAAPPAAPLAPVPGTSNGAGTGTNGALAANTGDAGIDSPCLAQDGTLYPTLYSTVGSQLTMAPNTHGMGKAKAFTVVAGALPPGMQLDRTFGVLFGVTTQPGSWVTTIKAKFADGSTKTSQFTTRVDADPQTLQYAAQNIGSVASGIAIAPTTNAPVVGTTYELVCGKLPSGTRFDTRTGAIVGKPTGVVTMPTPLRVAETSSSGKAAASFIFVVNKAGTTALSYPAHPHVRAGKRVAIRPTIAGVGDIAVIRMWKGKLPKGLRLNSRTGVISGRIAHGGPTHTITIVAVTQGGALLTAAPMRLRLQR